MDGILRRPFVSRSLGYDLYMAPQQIIAEDKQEGLVLRKEVPTEAAGMTFTLLNFEMGDHETMGESGMSVTAVIDVADSAGIAQTVMPSLVQGTDEDGHAGLIHAPSELVIDGMTYQVDISQLGADQGVVVLSIPGLVESENPDKLIVDLSKKPLIVLVWLGTTLVMLGSLASVLRRRKDLDIVSAPQGQQLA